MRKLLICDKNGTLVTGSGESGSIQDPSDQRVINGASNALERYKDNGWQVAIACCQPRDEDTKLTSAVVEVELAMAMFGISWGMFSYGDIDSGEAEGYLIKLFCGGFSTFNLGRAGYNRLPETYMVQALAVILGDEAWEEVLVVSDRMENKHAAEDASAEFMPDIRFMTAKEWREGSFI